MTLTQAAHHWEQVAAARRDFSDWWLSYSLGNKDVRDGPKAERIRIQTAAWSAWLMAKGLVK